MRTTIEQWEQITIDFIRRFFEENRITYTEYDRTGLWLSRFFNFRFRFIDLQPWQIRVSKELSGKLYTHTHKDACFDIFLKASLARNINPYQSKGLQKADVHDLLFNDWGMHHLHLNSCKRNVTDFFNDRSDYLLIARFENSIAYFIDIVKHKEENVWSLTDFIRIIQNNWPKLLSKYEVGVSWAPNLNDNDIGTLRKKGYTFGINVDGKSYLTLNHGYASSGDNFMAGRISDQIIRWGHKNNKLAETDKELFIQELRAQLGL